MPLKDLNKRREYHKKYLIEWKKKHPDKYKVYFKNFRKKHAKKISEKNKLNWEKIKAERPKKICLECYNEFSGRLNKEYCSDKCRERARFLRRKDLSNYKIMRIKADKKYLENGGNEKVLARNKLPKNKERHRRWMHNFPKGRLSILKNNEFKRQRKKEMTDWDKVSPKVIDRIRERDKVCVYCQQPFDESVNVKKETFDHFDCTKPFHEDNIVRACKSCNSSKADTPIEQIPDWIKKRGITPAQIVRSKLIQSITDNSKGKDTTYSSIWLTASLKDSFFKDKISEEGFSEFNPFVAKSIISFWSNEGDTILDPFAGRTRGIISSIMNRKYIGFEISPKVYSSVKEEFARLNINPELYNEDSNNIDKKEIKADMVLTCPPYWDLEKYESCPGQLSDIEDYNVFLERLKNIISKSCDKLKSGGYAAFVIGDFRKNEVYIPFHLDFINLCKSFPIDLHDLIILQNVQFGVALRRFGSHKHVKITGKCHEYLLIFKKR